MSNANNYLQFSAQSRPERPTKPIIFPIIDSTKRLALNIAPDSSNISSVVSLMFTQSQTFSPSNKKVLYKTQTSVFVQQGIVFKEGVVDEKTVCVNFFG